MAAKGFCYKYKCVHVIPETDRGVYKVYVQKRQYVALVQVFSAFCGMGILSVMNYEHIVKADARKTVALEVSQCIVFPMTVMVSLPLLPYMLCLLSHRCCPSMPLPLLKRQRS